MFLGNTHKISMIASKENIVRDGLSFYLDASIDASYPGTGSSWYDLANGITMSAIGTQTPYQTVQNVRCFSFNGSGYWRNDSGNDGLVDMGGNCSLLMFLYFEEQPVRRTIFEKNGTSYNSYEQEIAVTWETDEQLSYYSRRFSAYDYAYIESMNLPKNQWHLVALKMSTGRTSAARTGFYSLNGNPWVAQYTSRSNTALLSAGKITIGTGYAGTVQAGKISSIMCYNKMLSDLEIQQNYNILIKRFFNGTINNPFASPQQASDLGYADGNYYFRSGSMSSARLMEFKNNYYDNKPWVCAFRSPYSSTATTNAIDLNIPMGGLLVQRDTLDIRAAVYWSTPITYNSVGGSGNNTADSGYSPRRVILGYGGGHGIYNTGQSQCNWPNAVGAIGAGFNGSTCGSFPNGLLWGTGQSNTAVYANRSGVWSHWIYWQ